MLNNSSGPINGLTFLDKQYKLDTAADAEELAKKIEEFENLGYLELRGNTIGVEAGQRIAKALEKHPELKYALWSDLFTGRLKTEIPPILKSLCKSMISVGTTLTELDLSDNAFGPIGAEGIKEFLCSPSAFELRSLRLNNNGLGAGGVIIAECLLTCHALAKAQNKQFALKKFVAGRNRLEDPGAKALAKAFTTLGSLEEISIPQNGIRKDGIIALAECLAHNRNLRVVNFNDNTCTRKGALAIAFSLGDLTQLETLDLGDCLCRENGTMAIVSVLVSKPFKSLKTIVLSGNELPAHFVADLIDTWNQKDIKAKIFLSNNGFGSQFSDLLMAISDNGVDGLVDLGAESDDEGTIGSESEEEEEEEEEDETSDGEKYSGGESEEAEEEEEQGNDDVLAGEMGAMGFVEQKSQAPFHLSFLDQQHKWESEEDAEAVAAALEAHPEVTSFTLRGNTLGIAAGERIARALERCPRLQDCNWSDLFTSRLRAEIPIIVTRLCAAMIKAGAAIRSLDLSDNAFGPIGADSIKEFLESDSAFSLEELRLNNCGLGAGAVTVANSLRRLHERATAAGRKLNLKIIVAGRNRLEIPGAKAFADAIGAIGTLEELTVHQNGIHRPGVIALAGGVARNPHMKRLSVADNVGGWEGALAFAQSLSILRELESADFSDCLSKNKGCKALVDACLRLPNLKLLNLSGSELTGDVAEELTKKWSQSRTDKAVLNISTNNFSDAFSDIRDLAASLGGTVDVGESDDDCGSLSGDEDDGECEEDNEGVETSDGEKYSDEEEDYDEEEEDDDEEDDYEESDHERSGGSSYKENEVASRATTVNSQQQPVPARAPFTLHPHQQQQSLSMSPPITISSFVSVPTPSALRALSALGGDAFREMIEDFVPTRDQTESARLFLAVARALAADPSVKQQAVNLLDLLMTEVAATIRRPIPTIVQVINHIVAHVDSKINMEEPLCPLSEVRRDVIEDLLRELMQRGRMDEAKSTIFHYFPALAPAKPKPFTFNFGTPSTNPQLPAFRFNI